jgi:hypothetical protein
VSIKIYEGARFRQNMLPVFIEKVRTDQFKIVLEHVRIIAADLKGDAEAFKDGDTWGRRVMVTSDLLRDAANDHRRNPHLDVGCGWKIWLPPKSRFAYTSPWGEAWTRDFELPKFVEEYGYWDNTDPPEGMREGRGYQRWRARRKAWECATVTNKENNHVQLVSCDPNNSLDLATIHVELDRIGPPSAVDRLASKAPRVPGRSRRRLGARAKR